VWLSYADDPVINLVYLVSQSALRADEHILEAVASVFYPLAARLHDLAAWGHYTQPKHIVSGDEMPGRILCSAIFLSAQPIAFCLI